MANVTRLHDHRARRSDEPTAANAAVRSQRIYERITSKADSARRRDFALALRPGLTVEELARAVGLDNRDVRAIVDQEDG